VFVLAASVLGAEARSAKAAARAQTPPQAPAGPPAKGLVVGSGNFFSPIVSDLDKAVAFYRDGLGLDIQGAPSTADANPVLRNMFGLPDAKLRWQIGRPPAMRTGVEIVEIKNAKSVPIERRVQDSGAFMLIVFVRDIDATFARVKALGAPVVTTGGAPIGLPAAKPRYRVVVVKDPDGHFVEIVQADQPPETQAPPTANVIGVRVRLVVADVDKALALYRDTLGMTVRSVDEFKKDPDVNRMLGLNDGQYRVGQLEVPTTGLIFEVIDFKGVARKSVRGNIQDPGSTRIQLQVRDVDAAIDALKRHGGTVVSTGGTTVNLPGRGGATTKVAIVRDPDNLFLVLLQAAAPAATAQGNLGSHEDRVAVEDVMARYVWTVDSLDADGYVSVFTEDAVIDSNGSISRGHAEIRKIVTGLIQRRDENTAKGLPTSNLYHVISNVRITFPKPDEALHQSYWQTVRRDKDGRMMAAAMGRSEDRLVKRNGQWLIQFRKLTVFTD
jgi:uncharacterized protein (TIGR02246 family)